MAARVRARSGAASRRAAAPPRRRCAGRSCRSAPATRTGAPPPPRRAGSRRSTPAAAPAAAPPRRRGRSGPAGRCGSGASGVAVSTRVGGVIAPSCPAPPSGAHHRIGHRQELEGKPGLSFDQRGRALLPKVDLVVAGWLRSRSVARSAATRTMTEEGCGSAPSRQLRRAWPTVAFQLGVGVIRLGRPRLDARPRGIAGAPSRRADPAPGIGPPWSRLPRAPSMLDAAVARTCPRRCGRRRRQG